MIAELGRVRHIDAGDQRRVIRTGVHGDEIASRLIGGKLGNVPARRHLLCAEFGGFQVGADDGSRDRQEVQELIFLVECRDDDLHLSIFHVRRDRELVLAFERPHRPADDLAEELVVVGPAAPGGRPRMARVGGEGDGAP